MLLAWFALLPYSYQNIGSPAPPLPPPPPLSSPPPSPLSLSLPPHLPPAGVWACLLARGRLCPAPRCASRLSWLSGGAGVAWRCLWARRFGWVACCFRGLSVLCGGSALRSRVGWALLGGVRSRSCRRASFGARRGCCCRARVRLSGGCARAAASLRRLAVVRACVGLLLLFRCAVLCLLPSAPFLLPLVGRSWWVRLSSFLCRRIISLSLQERGGVSCHYCIRSSKIIR